MRSTVRDGVRDGEWIGRALALSVVGALCLGQAGWADTVLVGASRDATLIEDVDGAFANGSGPAFFVGRNSGFVARRALVAFDVAAALPPGAWVTGVALELEMTPSNRGPIDIGLHRVLTAWSEGPSSASGGGGAFSEAGDATWQHTHYDTELWDSPGGDFAPVASAVVSVGAAGPYVWPSSPGLVADVWGWLDDPASNHGWILVGGEDRRQTAKSFASREEPIEEIRPLLVVDFETRCDAFDLGRGALGLCRAYCEALDCAGAAPRGSARACEALARSFARRTQAALPCARPDLE